MESKLLLMSRYSHVIELLNIAVNGFSAKKTAHSKQVLVLNEPLFSRT